MGFVVARRAALSGRSEVGYRVAALLAAPAGVRTGHECGPRIPEWLGCRKQADGGTYTVPLMRRWVAARGE